MIILKVSLKNICGNYLEEAQLFFHDKADLTEYLDFTYNNRLDYDGEQEFMITEYGDILEVVEKKIE